MFVKKNQKTLLKIHFSKVTCNSWQSQLPALGGSCLTPSGAGAKTSLNKITSRHPLVRQRSADSTVNTIGSHRRAELKTYRLFRAARLSARIRVEGPGGLTLSGNGAQCCATVRQKELNNFYIKRERVVLMHYGGCQQASERTAVSLNYSTSASLVI